MSAMLGPVRNWRSFTIAGKPVRKEPLEASQAATKSWLPCWYSFTARSSARRSPAAGASSVVPPANCAKAGWPTAGIAGVSWFGAGGRRGLEPDVLAVLLP